MAYNKMLYSIYLYLWKLYAYSTYRIGREVELEIRGARSDGCNQGCIKPH